jgi:multidrug transporter EmrE-like cation transporter
MTSETTFKFIFFGLIIIAVALEIIADILLKKWSIENRNILFILGIILYFSGGIIWAFSLKYDYLSRAISIFSILNFIIIVLVGVLYFKEDLSLINKIGIGLGILSVILIEI